MERRYLVRCIDRTRAPVIRPAAGLTIAYRLPCGTASKRANVDHQIRLDDPAEAINRAAFVSIGSTRIELQQRVLTCSEIPKAIR